ncbi:MAG: V-type ATP synthase subunit D [Blastococcus sp.]
MIGPHGQPGGRAGRAWLRQRLATAQRGVELLHGKLRMLQLEQQRYHRQAEETAAEWAATCREAQMWLTRAALLGGRRAIAVAAPPEPAEVEVAWTVSMGVQHPREAVVRGGLPAETAALPGNSALVQAAASHRTALRAAARHAAVTVAVLRIDAEVAATRRRMRAIEDRWIPRLADALQAVELGLEELEIAGGSRVRWWATHRTAEHATSTPSDQP